MVPEEMVTISKWISWWLLLLMPYKWLIIIMVTEEKWWFTFCHRGGLQVTMGEPSRWDPHLRGAHAVLRHLEGVLGRGNRGRDREGLAPPSKFAIGEPCGVRRESQGDLDPQTWLSKNQLVHRQHDKWLRCKVTTMIHDHLLFMMII